ncbi:Os11g0147700 [Oryza sativa Japonica Group]|uniref:Os11g0147700 protein n=2 Tax=Oryza sativa subsp. japonica TaxID=39947 RepID=A0A0P0XYS0_ORYSJ|nr:hypothetical protein OsJ_32961 [Oryza sativa Japonica Group]KAB8114221.1 hypothetical protein EE612_053478 [Oryza sativa]BAH95080.1 Os11g0147700 [Oryza sativa Japonica Group]BAT12678.1 Os11g0147700 [Oryza sativa Japonica Group]|eukprot:NP_001176352.1 Os11g0147700 [Oryza sativa Japonica Group]
MPARAHITHTFSSLRSGRVDPGILPRCPGRSIDRSITFTHRAHPIEKPHRQTPLHCPIIQVLFRGTHWLRQWAKLQRHEDLRSQLIAASQHLESSALQFFSSNGWLSARHIGL